MNPPAQDCPKCAVRMVATYMDDPGAPHGSPVFIPTYCDGKDRVSGACLGQFPDHSRPARGDKTLHDHEHLHWRCRRCGFEILGPCADAASGR